MFSAVRRNLTAVFMVWRKKTAKSCSKSTNTHWFKKPQLSTVHNNKIVRFWTDMEVSRINRLINSALLHEVKNENFFFHQIGSNLSKIDQICPKWIKNDWIGLFINFKRKFEMMTLVRFSKYYLVSEVGLNQFSKHCSGPG